MFAVEVARPANLQLGAKGHEENSRVTYAVFVGAIATPGTPQSRILPRIRGTTIGACSEQYSWSL